MKHPTLLILDEPLQGLDPLNRQLVRRFVDVLIGEGPHSCCLSRTMRKMPRTVLPIARRSFPVETVTLISSAPWLTPPAGDRKIPGIFRK
ncbi:hypothetical protein J4734_08295 [Klebsiella pneumoniae]|uniref:Uncharacterized protein n=1 Tax=Klebsiella pneumoniae TaxID=573 RepID=A0A939SW30_KLEPN|nr:hypothetical protein [Klebsiella pneumoniae]